MGLTTSHPALRWAVPGAVVAVVLAAAGLTAATADASPTLPPRSAAELLVDVQTASVTALSARSCRPRTWGCPTCPIGMGGRGGADLTSLVSGTHTLRVWYSGEAQQRLALLGTLGESDIVRNGSDVWTWSSTDNTATHNQLPARPEGADGTSELPDSAPESALAMTPQQAAEAALAAIDPTTIVTTDGTAEVADRAAYELVLAPKDAASLIGQVRIAIDAEQHIPLRVRVIAKDAMEPAFEVGFSQISFLDTRSRNSSVLAAARRHGAHGRRPTQESPGPACRTRCQTGCRTRCRTVPRARPRRRPAPDRRHRLDVGAGGHTAPRRTPNRRRTAPDRRRTAPGRSRGGTGPGASGTGELQSVLGSLPQVSGDWAVVGC